MNDLKASFSSVEQTDRRVFQFHPLYSGGECDVDGFDVPVVCDLETLKIDNDPPALVDHDPNRICGKLENIRIEKDELGRSSVFCEAVVGGTAHARDLLNYTENGPVNLKPSIGVERIRWYDIDWVDKGQETRVNGRSFIGPIAVIRNGHLSEGSFVEMAGDPEAKALRARFKFSMKGTNMSFEEFLAQREITPEMFDALTPEEQAALKEEFDGASGGLEAGCGENCEEEEKVDAELDDGSGTEGGGENAVQEAIAEVIAEEVAELPLAEAEAVLDEVIGDQMNAAGCADDEEKVAAMKKSVMTKLKARKLKAKIQSMHVNAGMNEHRRIEAVKAVCASYGKQGAGICGKAIEHGWSAEKTTEALKAYAMKAKKMNTLSRQIPGRDENGTPRKQNVLQAAFAINCGLKPDYVKKCFKFDDATMNAAMSRENRHVSFKRLVHESVNSFRPGTCNVDTPSLDAVRDMRILCRNHHQNSLTRGVQAAMGFSTISATDIFKAVIEAYLLDQPEAAPTFYRQITKEVSFTDFNTVDAYLPTLIGKLSKISETGQIEHVGYTTTKLSAKTEPLGATFAIPEMVIINDQLSAFVSLLEQFRDLPEKCVEHDVAKLFWRMVDGDVNWSVDNNAFFSTTRGNIITGSGTALGESGLIAAQKALDNQTNDNGEPLSSEGAFIVCGSSLFAKAQRLYVSENLNVVDTIGERNVFAGLFKPYKWTYLNAALARTKKDNGSTDSDIQTYADSQWYLFRDPVRRPIMTVNKLVGYESPQIKEYDADPSVWGTVYQLIYPYSVSPMWPDGCVVCRGA